MPYAPSPQLLAALRTFDRPFICRQCCKTPRKPTRPRVAPGRRTFLSESVPSSKADRKQSKAATSASKAVYAEKGQTSYKSPLALKNSVLGKWELTVGIEIHAELNTSKKLFSAARTSLTDTPNTHVSVFDAALPGSQPQFQKETLLPAIRAALALGCEIQYKSSWDRKHYFWWDQPNGYQITQYYEPFAKNGQMTMYAYDGIDPVDYPSVTVGIKQVQMEQDTAKTIFQPPSTHLLDFNRVSHPLIEIITLPQIHSPKTAAALVRKIQSILKTVDANTTGMEMGGLRADVNVSVRRQDEAETTPGFSYGGVSGLGQRTEIKNLNSFKAVEEAIEAERDRQVSILEAGGAIEGETRGWTLGGTETRRIRGKEGEVDYRYMPDPDLPPLVIGRDVVEHLRATLPPLPDDMLRLLTNPDAHYGVTVKDARTLVALDDGDRLDYYLDVVHLTRRRIAAAAAAAAAATTPSQASFDDLQRNVGRNAANWVLHELGALLSASADASWTANRVSASHMAQILFHRLQSHITQPTAKRLLWMALNGSFAVDGDVGGGGAESVEAAEAAAISNYIFEKNLKLVPMSDKEYMALAKGLVVENPKMAKAAKEEEERADSKDDAAKQSGEAAGVEEGAGKKKKEKKGKMMWFVGQMLSRGNAPRMVPDQCKKAMRKALAQTST